MKSIILASASPRRQQLLSQIGIHFEVYVPSVDENALGSAAQRVSALSQKKARAALADLGAGHIILAADTLVEAHRQVLGKPGNKEQALAMLRALSGTWHSVYTGCCLIGEDGCEQVFYEHTRVHMRQISEEMALTYIASGEPMDKAGAYAIQGFAARWVDRIDGDYANVVGLPLAKVALALERL